MKTLVVILVAVLFRGCTFGGDLSTVEIRVYESTKPNIGSQPSVDEWMKETLIATHTVTLVVPGHSKSSVMIDGKDCEFELAVSREGKLERGVVSIPNYDPITFNQLPDTPIGEWIACTSRVTSTKTTRAMSIKTTTGHKTTADHRLISSRVHSLLVVARFISRETAR